VRPTGASAGPGRGRRRRSARHGAAFGRQDPDGALVGEGDAVAGRRQPRLQRPDGPPGGGGRRFPAGSGQARDSRAAAATRANDRPARTERDMGRSPGPSGWRALVRTPVSSAGGGGASTRGAWTGTSTGVGRCDQTTDTGRQTGCRHFPPPRAARPGGRSANTLEKGHGWVGQEVLPEAVPEGRPALRRHLGIRKQLADDFPSRPEFRWELANGHNDRGVLLKGTGRLKEAEAEYDAALGIYKQLAADFLSRPEFRSELAGKASPQGPRCFLSVPVSANREHGCPPLALNTLGAEPPGGTGPSRRLGLHQVPSGGRGVAGRLLRPGSLHPAGPDEATPPTSRTRVGVVRAGNSLQAVLRDSTLHRWGRG
jgi:hypothetical protein